MAIASHWKREPTPFEITTLAVALAGLGAPNEKIIEQGIRAFDLLTQVANTVRRKKEAAHLRALAEELDNESFKIRAWSHPAIQQISGYDKSHPGRSEHERGELLRDAFDLRIKRHYPGALDFFREKFRDGIPEDIFRSAWHLTDPAELREARRTYRKLRSADTTTETGNGLIGEGEAGQ
jgi:hypothetical protein